MNHYGKDVEKKQDAVEVCIDGLMDEETHLSRSQRRVELTAVYRPGLSRRLTRLEKQLDLPADERHICDAELKVCSTRTLSAPRAKENAGIARHVKANEGTAYEDEIEGGRAPPAQVGRSVWHGREGEVSVEGWVLEWWENKGYKGYVR
jgi:Fanconi-associated nuclease 1